MKKKNKIAISLILSLFLVLAIASNFNEIVTYAMFGKIDYAKFEVVGDTATMTGTIGTRTVDDVRELLENNPKLKNIIMVNVPGSIDDESNLVASRLIRNRGINTHVPSDGMIASGGTDFFLAGLKRTADEGAEIGVHSWAGDGVEDATKLAKDHVEHKKYLDYYKEMDIPEEFYWFTIKAAPASSIYNVTRDDMIKYKMLTE